MKDCATPVYIVLEQQLKKLGLEILQTISFYLVDKASSNSVYVISWLINFRLYS